MTIKKFADSQWSGDIKTGKGAISTESKALDNQPYGFATRFEGQPGTNPEELIAAAHSACFSMALSKALGDQNYLAKSINTNATVDLEQVPDGFEVSKVALTVTANVPDIEESTFQEICEQTKTGCPISKLLKAEITLTTNLTQ